MTETNTPAALLASAAAELGLTMTAVFVPFSQSRNAVPGVGRDAPWRSLNWRVTLERNGRPFLTTDYSQGEGHTPAAQAKSAIYARAHYTEKQARRMAVSHEIETGRRASWSLGELNKHARQPIDPPALPDVLWSLIQDASVIDYPSFEAWASEYGYDTDSRSAETIYRACLETALQLRSAIGESGIEALRTAGEDF